MKRVLHQAILLSLAVLASSAASAQQAMSVGDGAYAIAVNGNLQVGPINLPIVQEPADEVLSPAIGGDNHVSVASVNVPLGLLNLATLSGVQLDAQASPAGISDSGQATAAIGNLSLLGGLVSANNINTFVSSSGTDASGTPIVTNTASTTIGNLSVGGIPIAGGAIAPNTTVGVSGMLPVNIAGLLHANIPVSGQLTLNEQSALGPHGLDVNAMHLRVAGNLLGLAALNLDVIVGGPNADNETPAGGLGSFVLRSPRVAHQAPISSRFLTTRPRRAARFIFATVRASRRTSCLARKVFSGTIAKKNATTHILQQSRRGHH